MPSDNPAPAQSLPWWRRRDNTEASMIVLGLGLIAIDFHILSLSQLGSCMFVSGVASAISNWRAKRRAANSQEQE